MTRVTVHQVKLQNLSVNLGFCYNIPEDVHHQKLDIFVCFTLVTVKTGN